MLPRTQKSTLTTTWCRINLIEICARSELFNFTKTSISKLASGSSNLGMTCQSFSRPVEAKLRLMDRFAFSLEIKEENFIFRCWIWSTRMLRSQFLCTFLTFLTLQLEFHGAISTLKRTFVWPLCTIRRKCGQTESELHLNPLSQVRKSTPPIFKQISRYFLPDLDENPARWTTRRSIQDCRTVHRNVRFGTSWKVKTVLETPCKPHGFYHLACLHTPSHFLLFHRFIFSEDDPDVGYT